MQTHNTQEMEFLPRGVVADAAGRVAGFWIRGRKGRPKAWYFARPIAREKHVRVECKDIMIDGVLHKNVPVEVHPSPDCILHWGKR